MIGLLPLLYANLKRRRTRTILTILSVAVAFLLFGILEALRYALLGGVELAGADRLMTTHKVSFIQPLPRSYLNRVRGVDGVRVATSFGWFGGYYQDVRNQIVAQFTDQDELAEVYPEILVNPVELAVWKATRNGALIGESLARSNSWKIGDRIPLHSSIYRQANGNDTWDLVVSGIYGIREGAGDTNGLMFRYDYFNESVTGTTRDRAGWIVLRVKDPAQMTEVARRIDALFANSFTETKTSSERAFAQGFVNQFGNIGAIITGIVSAVFFTMLLVTANTMAQSIRERTAELAVMKTLGFSGRQMLTLVLAESILLTLIGGALGMLLANAVVNVAQKAMSQYLPLLHIQPEAWLLATGFVMALGLAAGVVPAWQAWRLNIVTALRRT